MHYVDMLRVSTEIIENIKNLLKKKKYICVFNLFHFIDVFKFHDIFFYRKFFKSQFRMVTSCWYFRVSQSFKMRKKCVFYCLYFCKLWTLRILSRKKFVWKILSDRRNSYCRSFKEFASSQRYARGKTLEPIIVKHCILAVLSFYCLNNMMDLHVYIFN